VRSGGDGFSAFQLILSNGESSPVFAAKGENNKNLQAFTISDFAAIKRVKGNKKESVGSLNKLCFSKKDGTVIAKVELNN